MVKKNQGKAKSAFLLLCFFLCEQTFPQSLSAENVSEASPPPDFSITDFINQVPYSYGSVSERYQGSKGRFILHIQDPHAQFEAQKNIAQVISIFSKALPKGSMPLILVEGAQGMVDVSPLACIQDKDTRERISECFLKRGWLSGAEYYAIMNLEEPILFGIDEKELYLQNLNYFKKAQSLKVEFSQEIDRIQNAFKDTKTRFFSKELLAFNDYVSAYSQGQLSLEKYASFLKKARKKEDSLKQSYPSFSKFLRMTSLQKKMDPKASNEEVKNLLIRLQSQLNQENLKKLIEETLLQKLNKVSQSDFFKFLYQLSLKENIDWSNYPNLKRFVRILSLRDSISFPDFSKELKTLENEIRLSLYRNEEEKDLGQFFRFLDGLKNFSQLNLSHEEFETYLKEKGIYFVEKWKALVEKFSSQSTSFVQQDFLKGFLGQCLTIEGFYETAVKRDQAILSKTFEKIKEEKAPFAVLITGGFHTPGLTQGFKHEHVSYVVMTPTLSSKVNDAAYLSVMNGVLTPFDSGFKSLSQALAPASSFALDPFGNAVPWETILAQAMVFQEFLEKARDTKGESLIQAYEDFVKTAKIGWYGKRVPLGERKNKLKLMKEIASQLEIDWDHSVFLNEDLFVIVKVGESKRVIRIKKRALNDEDDDTLRRGDFEEMGQLGKNISFYVLPEKIVDLFEDSPKDVVAFIENIFRAENDEKDFIPNATLEEILYPFTAEQLRRLGEVFNQVRVIHYDKRIINNWFFPRGDYLWPRTLTFIEGQIHALSKQIQNDSLWGAMEARIALIKIYYDLANYYLSIENDEERARDYCERGLFLTKALESDKMIFKELENDKIGFEEMDRLKDQLKELLSKLKGNLSEGLSSQIFSSQETNISVWKVFYTPERAPMAFVLEEDPDLDKQEGQALAVERMEWLGRMVNSGFKKGDAVFLNGLLAYPFLKAKDLLPVEFMVSDNLVQVARKVINLFETKGIEFYFYLPIDYSHSVHGHSKDISRGQAGGTMSGDLGDSTLSIYSERLQNFEHVVALGDRFPLVNRGNGTSKGLGKILWGMMKDQRKRDFYFIGPQWTEEQEGFEKLSGAQHHITVNWLSENHALGLFEGKEGILREVRTILEGSGNNSIDLAALLKGLEGLEEFKLMIWAELSKYILNQVIENFSRYGSLEGLFGVEIWDKIGITSSELRDIGQIMKLIEKRPVNLFVIFLNAASMDEEKHRQSFFKCLSPRGVRVANILALDLFPDLPDYLLGDEDRTIEMGMDLVEALREFRARAVVDQSA